MAQALPLAKVASLLIKTIAKPVSKRIKHEFSRNKHTKRLLVGIGQTSHMVTSRMTIYSAGYRVRSIAPLEEEKALSRGADFVGESFILMVSISTMVWELNRSKEKEELKAERQRAQAKAERDALAEKFRALDARLKAVEEVVAYNSSSIFNMVGKTYVEPPEKKLVPMTLEEENEEQHERRLQVEGGPQQQTTVKGGQHHVEQIHNPKPIAADTTQETAKSWWKFW